MTMKQLLAAWLFLLALSAPSYAQNKGANGAYDAFSQNSLIIASARHLGATTEDMSQIIGDLIGSYGAPHAIIRGNEISVTAVIGARYGRGTLLLANGSQSPIHWRGPSFGVDIGAAGSKTFALVYNVKEADDLYRRFVGVDGTFIAFGGVSTNSLRGGGMLVVPTRVGTGIQMGVNMKYLKFRKGPGWLPF